MNLPEKCPTCLRADRSSPASIRQSLERDAETWQAEAARLSARVDELEAHIKTITEGCARENLNIEQICGKALGYPRYCDDQENFPGATEEDGVCVGEHVAASIASELANKYRDLLARVKRLEEAAREVYLDSIASDHAWSTNETRNMHALRDALEAKPCPHCLRVECECSDFDVAPDIGDK